MTTNTEVFKQSFNRLIASEGGYINDSADPGGDLRYAAQDN
jgi:lysozyme family protein